MPSAAFRTGWPPASWPGHGRLYLSGVDAEVTARWTQAGYAERAGQVRIYEASPRIGESTTRAFEYARTHAVVPVADAPA